MRYELPMSSPKLTLHPADPNLAPMLYEWRQDEVMKKYNPLMPSSVEEVRERLAKNSSNLDEFDKAEAFFWFVQLNGEHIGNVSHSNVNKMMLTAEIGYNVISSARGKGIATEVVKLATRNIFEKTSIRKLIAFVHEENLPSIRVLEKVGYKREGLLREHYLVNGKPANEVVFGLLRKEHL